MGVLSGINRLHTCFLRSKEERRKRRETESSHAEFSLFDARQPVWKLACIMVGYLQLSAFAPGVPGIEPRFTHGAKNYRCRAYSTFSRMWQTLDHGGVTEEQTEDL